MLGKEYSLVLQELLFNLSFLKNFCRKFQIPLPPNAYWMKRKYGIELGNVVVEKQRKPSELEKFLKQDIEFLISVKSII